MLIKSAAKANNKKDNKVNIKGGSRNKKCDFLVRFYIHIRNATIVQSPLEEINDYLLIISFFRSGTKARRRVPPLNTQ